MIESNGGKYKAVDIFRIRTTPPVTRLRHLRYKMNHLNLRIFLSELHITMYNVKIDDHCLSALFHFPVYIMMTDKQESGNEQS